MRYFLDWKTEELRAIGGRLKDQIEREARRAQSPVSQVTIVRSADRERRAQEGLIAKAAQAAQAGSADPVVELDGASQGASVPRPARRRSLPELLLDTENRWLLAMTALASLAVGVVIGALIARARHQAAEARGEADPLKRSVAPQERERRELPQLDESPKAATEPGPASSGARLAPPTTSAVALAPASEPASSASSSSAARYDGSHGAQWVSPIDAPGNGPTGLSRARRVGSVFIDLSTPCIHGVSSPLGGPRRGVDLASPPGHREEASRLTDLPLRQLSDFTHEVFA